MRKTLAVAAILVATAGAAAAGTGSGTQNVMIEATGGTTESFVLTPITAGRIRRDAGALTSCCWSVGHVVRAGDAHEVDDPHLTLTGARGTLRFHNRIEWIDLPDGWSTFSGTWKVEGGTGAYAALSGSGRVSGVTTANGYTRVRLFGYLTHK